MKLRLLAILMLGTAVSATMYFLVVPHGRLELPDSAVLLELTADKLEYSLGEKPGLKVTLTNVSGKTIQIVPPVRRYDSIATFPTARFRIIPPPMADERGKMVVCRDGPANFPTISTTLRPNQSIVLATGLTADEWRDLDRGPGQYALSFTYSTYWDAPQGTWLTTDNPAALNKIDRLLRDVQVLSATSNSVVLTYTSPLPDLPPT